MTADISQLEQRSETLHGRYVARFAGHARITRDASMMTELIKDTESLLAELGIPEAALLREQVAERLDMYKRERESILDAQKSGVDAVDAAVLGQRANFVFSRYRRHFAGKQRKTRDLGLLADCLNVLEKLRTDMHALAERHREEGLQNDINVVERNIELYKRERGEIVAAREMQLIDKKAEMLAEMANLQFALYKVHFAGKSRLSRRPGLMQRMIHNLENIRDQMQSHKAAGLRSNANNNNIKIVVDHLKLYRRELNLIRKSRRDAGASGVIDALASSANQAMEQYRNHFAGQDRATRDLELLHNICDLMGELERQMHAIDAQGGNDTNRRNLHIVRDMLAMYEREYLAVRDAQP